MFDSVDRTITVPVGRAWRFGVGAQYQMAKDIILDFAYVLAI
ncbi:MAG: hypothetical protein IT292_05070 [Deltaproteobacteria bacterium]|nr:hypothetical protein [Deltaproteobacteria bacterium]